MDVVAFGNVDRWEWGWDALVAIGTLLLGFVAVAVPWTMELQRSRIRAAEWRRQAGYLSTVFDHELNMVEKLAAGIVDGVTEHRKTDL